MCTQSVCMHDAGKTKSATQQSLNLDQEIHTLHTKPVSIPYNVKLLV